MTIRSPWLLAFGVVSVVHLVLNTADLTPWDSISKCFIAPLLMAWVIEQGGPRLLVLALGFCFLGDLFLELGEDVFVIGMAAFAAGHICFITFFVRRGALPQLRSKAFVIALYVIAAIGLVAWCWGGLDAAIRPAIPVYAALLVGTASVAIATDLRAGVGGLVFLVSDAIIALGEADRVDKDAPAIGLAIMTLYILAVLLLTSGILDREKRTLAAGSNIDPTIRTDCWPRLPAQSS